MSKHTHTLFAVLLLFGILAVSPADATAQQADLERAVLAAPSGMGADATVLALNDDGSVEVLREGSNGLICWNSEAYDARFTSMCTSEANRERIEETHRVRQTAGGREAAESRLQEMEANGERAEPQFGTFMFRAAGEDGAGRHTTIFVPGATPESLGLPAGRQPAALMLHQPGTSSAHLMLARGM